METRQPHFDSAVAAFLAGYSTGGPRVAWIDILDTKTNEKVGEVYVRIGRRTLDGTRIETFDIANVQVDSDKVGQGIFTRWLNRLEFCLKFQSEIKAVYIEIVQELRFREFIKSRDYTEYQYDDVTETASYYRLVEPYPDSRFVAKICYIGHGPETCSWIVMGAEGWSCAKLSSFRGAIEDRREHMSAQADNCSGLRMRPPSKQ